MIRPILALLCAILASNAAMADEPKPADGDAPLAEGFPEATKPGKVEVKQYPGVSQRRGLVDKATMSLGQHDVLPAVQPHPEEQGRDDRAGDQHLQDPRMIETPGAKGEMTMEFVYRTPKLGQAGPDGEMIKVEDHPAQRFVCLGYQGDMNDKGMKDGVGQLRKWLDDHKAEWVEDGPPRRLGYHGPMTPAAQRLWEVQIPVKAAAIEKK